MALEPSLLLASVGQLEDVSQRKVKLLKICFIERVTVVREALQLILEARCHKFAMSKLSGK